jgi:hypothetical protein
MKHNKKSNGNQRIVTIDSIISIGGLISLMGIYYGFQKLDNYIHWVLFPLLLIGVGICIGYITFVGICYFEPQTKRYTDERGTGILFKLILLNCFMILGIGVFVNQNFTAFKTKKTFVITDKFVSQHKGSDDYFVRIAETDGPLKLNLGQSFYSEHPKGGQITLSITTGILGFAYYEIYYPKL